MRTIIVTIIANISRVLNVGTVLSVLYVLMHEYSKEPYQLSIILLSHFVDENTEDQRN